MATVNGTAHPAGAGTLSAKVTQRTTAALAGASTLSVPGHQIIRAAAVLHGTGTLSAKVTQRPKLALAGGGALSAAPMIIVSGTASLHGAGTLGAHVTQRPRAALQGLGSVTSHVTQRPKTVLTGAGTLTPRVTQRPKTIIHGAGALSAVSREIIRARASLHGAGALTPHGTEILRLTAAAHGAGTFSAHGRQIIQLHPVPLAGHGTLTAHAREIIRATAVLHGTGTAHAAPHQILKASRGQLAGAGSLGAVASIVPPSPRTAPVQPLWTRDPQAWAITQERMRHEQAMWMLGELSMFALMWHIQDFEAGLVGRCLTCYVAEGSVAAAYGQGNQYRCPDCFGTTFEGGWRAIIIRPALFRDMDKDQQRSARGVVNQAQTSIESTADFRVRTGDYAFRQTGDRFYLRVPRRTTLRTGFATPYQSEAAIDYVHASATVEDPVSPAYMIFPDAERLISVLQLPGRLPGDVSGFDPAMVGRP
jgi:hypothetical protein